MVKIDLNADLGEGGSAIVNADLKFIDKYRKKIRREYASFDKFKTRFETPQELIDLVLADQNMPRLDGIGLTRKLREHPKFKTVPILILTTESSDQMKQAGRSAGATGWLVKPFDPNRLIEVIRKVIR